MTKHGYTRNLQIVRDDIIKGASRMADEIIRLGMENERLKHQLLETPGREGMTPIQAMFYEKGREEIFKAGYSGYRGVAVSRKDDGTLSVDTKFERWAKESLDSWGFPSCISKDDFLREFDAELREKYEEKKAEAIAALEEEE